MYNCPRSYFKLILRKIVSEQKLLPYKMFLNRKIIKY
jgi:hypothetical protein